MDKIVAPVFDVQRFSIHDGPGIRTLVFFKGCNLRCDWCQNPESQQTEPIISYYIDRCENSMACYDVCPENAIDPDGFRIDHERCTGCLKCVDACYFNALKPIGEMLTATQLMDVINRDVAYYQSSGGGVTFSGGEPTLYPKFMDNVLSLCQAKGIHTTLETCGSFSFSRWKNMFDSLDLIYFDLKIMDNEKHKKHTHSDNFRILGNARRLVEEGYPVEFRMTLVDGYTDDQENLDAVRRFLKSLKVSALHLQSYQNMGETKIDIINGGQKKLNSSLYPQPKFDDIKAWFLSHSIEIY